MRALVLGVASLSLSAALLAACQDGSGTGSPSPAALPHDVSGVWLGVPVPLLEPIAPMTPAGQALFDAARPMWGSRSVSVARSNDPLVTCDPLGFPRSVLHETRGMEFVQGPNKVVQLLQYQRVFREIWTDGRSLPTGVGSATPGSPDPKRYGYSIGRWTADGLFVVETTGATETGWANAFGHPHGLAARVEERYRRLGADALELVVTIDDPEMYRKPFVAMTQVLTRGTELEEQLCVPSEAQQYLEIMAKPAAGTR